jgi:hypothetical protein
VPSTQIAGVLPYEHRCHFRKTEEGDLSWCVKAGSIKQGNGPEYTTLTADADLVHASGKGLSHVSVVVDGDPTPEPTEPPVIVE